MSLSSKVWREPDFRHTFFGGAHTVVTVCAMPFLRNSDYSDNLAIGSKLSDNQAEIPKKLDLTFGDLRCIINLQGKGKHRTPTKEKIKKLKKSA